MVLNGQRLPFGSRWRGGVCLVIARPVSPGVAADAIRVSRGACRRKSDGFIQVYRPKKCCLQKPRICAGPVMSVVVNICERERGGRREKSLESQGGWVRKLHSDKGPRRHGKREGDRTKPGRQKDEQRPTSTQQCRGMRRKCQEREGGGTRRTMQDNPVPRDRQSQLLGVGTGET